jgi:S-(hydroxymethyl)glutathione dehydrogenase/alcohol dehydrogenase
MSLTITKTLAAILHKSKHSLIVDEIILPKKLFLYQVLVKIESSGICGAQINEIDALKGPDKFLPHLLGHEAYGKVIEVGPGVTTVNLGDTVILHWRPGTGGQGLPAEYLWRGNKLNAGWVTTFNNHCVVSENRVTKITRSPSDKSLLPLLGCALTTAYGVLTRDTIVKEQDSILIFGAGGVGLSLIKIAKFLNIKSIVVVDISENKLNYAKILGASNCVQFIKKKGTLEDLKKIYKNKSPQIAIDTTGNVEAIEICYEITAATADIVLVGVPKFGSLVRIHTLPLHFGKSLKGSHGGDAKPESDIPYLLDLFLSGLLDFSDYPTKSYSLMEINLALENLRNGTAGRMIINF